MELSLTSGIVPLAFLVLAVLSFAILLTGRGRRWWGRTVPLALLTGTVVMTAVAWFSDHVWHPFADPIPTALLVWSGLAISGLVLAVRRPAPWTTRVAAASLVLLIALNGAVRTNVELGTYPTMAAALEAPESDQLPSADVLTTDDSTVDAAPGQPLADVWTAPADLPTEGTVTSVAIPGTVSGFPADDAWIYLPPAYRSNPRARLPVLMLLSGQPGIPRNWFDGSSLARTMDAYAAAHHGLAPVVVVPDWLGGSLANPMCVDSRSGVKDFSYLTVDVPNWVQAHLQVDPDPTQWAVGGLSAGGTCAVQLAVNAPARFPTFLGFSVQDHPTIGDHADTVATLFGGDEAAYDAVDPLKVLAARSFPGSAGILAAGASDTVYGPQTRTVYAAAQAAGMQVRYLELPGGHDSPFWAAALAASMPWLGTRLGLTA